MKSKIIFTDGEVMNRNHPDTFPIPSEAEKRAIRVGDLVKVCAEGERFWVIVTKFNWPHLTGTVDNVLMLATSPALDYGKSIDFEARHILDIMTVAQLEMEKRMGGRLARLDQQTAYFVRKNGDAITIVVFHDIPTGPPNSKEDEYQKSFVAAAEKLDLHPEEQTSQANGGKSKYLLLLKLPAGISDFEIHNAVRETVESLRKEVTRNLEGKGEDGVDNPTTNGE